MVLFGRKKEEAQGTPPGMGETPDMGVPPEGMPPEQYSQDAYGAGYAQGGYAPDQGYAQNAPQQYAQPSEPQPMAAPPQVDKEMIEETAEAIVEEKWKEKKKELDKITEWREESAEKMTKLQQQINDLRASFDSLNKGILGKISQYDDNLANVGTEIKAMEKVFSKVLPSMTDSVNKLQRISSSARKR
ncbi:hypothetical protein KY358_06345 [Candidatus Woesearchaeota archaeon]|nr:hypothetical protein [Candidatus Woesearchaeota archaeon]